MDKKDLMTKAHKRVKSVLTFDKTKKYRDELSKALKEGYKSFKCRKVTPIGVKYSIKKRNFWDNNFNFKPTEKIKNEVINEIDIDFDMI